MNMTTRTDVCNSRKGQARLWEELAQRPPAETELEMWGTEGKMRAERSAGPDRMGLSHQM